MTVLDASALLAFLQGEAGADVVEAVLQDDGVCAAVNWSETAQKVRARGADWPLARSLLIGYGVAGRTRRPAGRRTRRRAVDRRQRTFAGRPALPGRRRAPGVEGVDGRSGVAGRRPCRADPLTRSCPCRRPGQVSVCGGGADR